MMRAAICDDESTMLDYLYEHISKEFKQQNADAQIEKFISGKDFLSSHKSKPYDVAFLDIDMPEINGFEIAEQINNIAETLIVFVTLHDELVFSSLKFRPFRFIRKEYLDKELPETLESIIIEIAKKKSGVKFALQTKSGETSVNLNNIIYIEIYGHWLRVCLKNGETLECYGSLSNFEKQLDEYDFVRTHKSFLINSKYIFSIEKNQVVLDDKTVIPLSRYKVDAVKDKFKKLIRSTL